MFVDSNACMERRMGGKEVERLPVKAGNRSGASWNAAKGNGKGWGKGWSIGGQEASKADFAPLNGLLDCLGRVSLRGVDATPSWSLGLVVTSKALRTLPSSWFYFIGYLNAG